jgi:hypothetical protein
MQTLRRPVEPTAITASEALIGAGTIVILAVAEASLLLADVRQWTLAATLGLAAAAVVVLGAIVVRHRPIVTLAPAQVIAVVVTGIVAALFALPGFPVGHAGLDPGVYTNHAFSIARNGSFDVPDPVAEHRQELPALQENPNARLPGMAFESKDGDRSLVGFYHLFPALAAPAADVAGERGVVNVNPILGIITTLLLLLLGWRAFGPVAGWAAGLLSATNVIQVWHARYPTSEILTELLLVFAFLAIAIAVETRWRFAAGIAGACVGMTFLARADGVLLIGLAAGVLVVLSAVGRFDRRAAWFTFGLGVVLVHGFYQAYHLLRHYTADHLVPTQRTFGGGLLLLALLGIAAHLLRRSSRLGVVDTVVERFRDPRWQRRVGVATVGLTLLIVGFNYLRPLWGDDRPLHPDLPAADAYFNARSMLRLTWFFTPLGIALAIAGVAFVACRRWRFTSWLVVAPTLLILPIYLWHAHIDVRLIWWTRRFVPVAVPGLILLSACAIAALVGMRRSSFRALGAIAGVVLIGWWTTMAWPVRDHDELAGSFLVHQALTDAVKGESPAWLWSTVRAEPGIDVSANAFAATLLLRDGHPVSMVDEGHLKEGVDAFEEVFPDRQLFVVVDGDEAPSGLASRLTEVTTIAVGLPYWEITYDRRPTEAGTLPYRFTVWRVD